MMWLMLNPIFHLLFIISGAAAALIAAAAHLYYIGSDYSGSTLVIPASIGAVAGLLSGKAALKKKSGDRSDKRVSDYFAEIIENSNEVVFTIDRNHIIQYISPSIKAFLGYSHSQLSGQPFSVIVSSLDVDSLNLFYIAVKKNFSERINLRVIDKTGEEKWVRISCKTFADDSRIINGLMVDITDIVLSEKKIHESEENFRIVFDNAGEFIFIHDILGKFINANQYALDRLGYTIDEIFSFSPVDIVCDKDNVLVANKEVEINEKGKTFFETSFKSKNGTLIPVEVYSKIIYYNSELCVLCLARDMTERIQLEKERIKSDRLMSLGVLAGGIAHDFNNILLGILGNISLSRLLVKNDEELKTILEEAEKATIRAKHLTSQLLTFSKGGSPVKNYVSIKDFIREITSFTLRGTNILPEFIFSDDLENIFMDETQMSQVINNIVLNAQQSMPSGGAIRIKAENIDIHKGLYSEIPPGRYLKLDIQDSGCGISPENIERIFDPFFTTKNHGNGLGLATSYSIVKKHGGHISVASEVGKGTCFSIYLPFSVKNNP